MRLLILSGPPGVGKLTIAKEIAPRIGAKVFHNHVVIDAVEPVVTRRHPHFTPLIYGLQRQILVAAMEARQVDIVFTFAFSLDEREGVDVLSDLVAADARLDVNVALVYLTCDRAELRRRIADDSRRAHGKLRDVEALDALFKQYDLTSPHPSTQLTLDTTTLSPGQAAVRILASLNWAFATPGDAFVR